MRNPFGDVALGAVVLVNEWRDNCEPGSSLVHGYSKGFRLKSTCVHVWHARLCPNRSCRHNFLGGCSRREIRQTEQDSHQDPKKSIVDEVLVAIESEVREWIENHKCIPEERYRNGEQPCVFHCADHFPRRPEKRGRPENP